MIYSLPWGIYAYTGIYRYIQVYTGIYRYIYPRLPAYTRVYPPTYTTALLPLLTVPTSIFSERPGFIAASLKDGVLGVASARTDFSNTPVPPAVGLTSVQDT
jgi:hypothetical protein